MTTLKEMVGDWDLFMREIFNDPLIINNLNTINTYYKYSNNGTGSIIYPEQINVFKAFQECPYEKLSVVILLQDPYHNGSATGIAMANEVGTKLSPSLRIVKDIISKTIYNREEFNFDPTLVSWANQGVLLLNTALTVYKGKPGSHKDLWNAFTKAVLKKLSEINSGIIYCLWGNFAQEYIPLINSLSNTILLAKHPVASVYSGIPWECDHFVKINKQLKDFNNLNIIW